MNNFMSYKKTILVFILLGFVLGCVYILSKYTKSKDFLDFIARFYFDKAYYLEKYPEVKKLEMEPFEHYSSIGWLEGKNPNAEFDNNFYRRMYLTFPAQSLELSPLQHSIRCKIRFQTCYINPKQLKKAELLKNPKYYLSLAAIFRDEARFLKEWIEFYKLMGVDHFYLYNNLSKDNYLEILEPYIKEGMVELKDVNYNATAMQDFNKFQESVYIDAAEKSKNDTEWLIIIDTDEFMYPVKGKDLVETLKNYDDYAAVTINWQFFGSWNVKKIPTNKLLIESLTMWGPLKSKFDNSGKTVVKPRYIESFMSAHFPKLKKGYAQITENYEYFYGSITPYYSANILAINHYSFRDWDFFWSTKIARAHVVGDTKDKQKVIDFSIQMNKGCSKEYDKKILRFVPELRAKVFEE